MRLRAQHLATLELGPETLELRAKLQAEAAAERFTRIDRAMLREARDRMLDLRAEAGQCPRRFRSHAAYRPPSEFGTLWARPGRGAGSVAALRKPRADHARARRARRHRQSDEPSAAKRGQQRELESYDLHGDDARLVRLPGLRQPRPRQGRRRRQDADQPHRVRRRREEDDQRRQEPVSAGCCRCRSKPRTASRTT